MLISAMSPNSVTETFQPDWVKAWIDSREAKQDKKSASDDSEVDNPIATKPKAVPGTNPKTIAAREAKIAVGLENIELWLRDVMRAGLAELASGSHRQFEDQAARLVDSQAPGLAQMVRDLAGIASTGIGWQDRMLEKIGLIVLLIDSYRKQEMLPKELRADVRGLIGWTQSQEVLLAGSGVEDRWIVLGSRSVPFGKLTEQRTWIWGTNTKQFAVIIQYIARGMRLGGALPQGLIFNGEVVYFESAAPLRALVKTQNQIEDKIQTEFPNLTDSLAGCLDRLNNQPWTAQHPLGISNCHVAQDSDKKWRLLDYNSSEWIPFSPLFDDISGWRLAALCGDNPSTIFGEWDSYTFCPISIWHEGSFVGI
jgi:hypothetical protein